MDKDIHIFDESRFRSPLEIKSRKDSSRLTINDDLFDQETVRLKSIWEELNPVDDIVDNDLFDLIDNIDSPNTVFDKFDEEDLL